MLWSGEKQLVIGREAPQFALLDQEGTRRYLSDHRGQFVLLFFYPRDFTPYCTREAKAFEMVYKQLQEQNVVVYGISTDPVKSHKEFHSLLGLHYDLLSDVTREVIDQYHATGWIGTKRMSCLIGPDGKIFKVYSSVNPQNHPFEVLRDITN